jgi:4-hydroxy-3-methylbut-2-enyl diphosphate reductase
MAVAPDAVHLIQSTEDVDRVRLGEGPFALLSQTTLSYDEWQHLRDYVEQVIPDIWMPNRSDLCFATTNRQAALRAVAANSDAVIVIGSANSSNTVALTKVATASGSKRVLRVNQADELPDDLEGVVAVTAGASAPERLVDEVLQLLQPHDGINETSVTVEDEYFPPPPELRELLRALGSLTALAFGQHADGADPTGADREYSAAQVLDA